MRRYLSFIASALIVTACGSSMSHTSATADQLRAEYDHKVEKAKDELVRCKEDVSARTNILRSLEVAAAAAGLNPMIAVAEVLNNIRDQVGKRDCDDMYDTARAHLDEWKAEGERHRGEVEAFV